VNTLRLGSIARHHSTARLLGALTVIAFAVCWARYVLGAVPLDVHDVHWLWGDLSQVHTAWRQYLSDPDVVWLASTRMSHPLPLSIALFDPMPLLLLLARPVASFVEPGTQYFGYYFLMCLVLQALFAYLAALAALERIGASKGGGSVIVAICCACLIASVPYTFYRFQGHTALSSQWVLVLSIWAALATLEARGSRWYIANCSVVLLATGLNPYLALMVCISGGTLALSCVRTLGFVEVLRRLLAIGVVAATGLALFGFVGGSTAHSGGYGVYSMNVLGPFDSHGIARLLPLDVPDATGGQTFEGYTYMGLGALSLMAIALLAYVNHRAPDNRFPFVPVLTIALLCTALAVSATVTVASHSLEIPLPGAVTYLLSRFRGSGRFFWMAGFWLIVLSVCACTLRFGVRRAAALLMAVTALQIIDVSTIGENVRSTIASGNALRVDGIAAGHYNAVLVFPAWQCDNQHTPAGGVRNYEAVGDFAARLKVPTNNFYAARTPADQTAYHCDYDARFQSIDPQALYLVSGAIYAERGERLRVDHNCSPLQPGQDEWKCTPKRD
jgi:hypothetical protein